MHRVRIRERTNVRARAHATVCYLPSLLSRYIATRCALTLSRPTRYVNRPVTSIAFHARRESPCAKRERSSFYSFFSLTLVGAWRLQLKIVRSDSSSISRDAVRSLARYRKDHKWRDLRHLLASLPCTLFIIMRMYSRTREVNFKQYFPTPLVTLRKYIDRSCRFKNEIFMICRSCHRLKNIAYMYLQERSIGTGASREMFRRRYI